MSRQFIMRAVAAVTIAAGAVTATGPRAAAAPTLDDVVAIDVAAGWDLGCTLLQDGTAFCAGANNEEELGINDTDISESSTPLQVDAPAGAVEIDSYDEASCLRYANGDVRCWGDNADLQTGVPGGGNIAQPTLIAGLPPVSSISLGDTFGCSIATADGTVWCWGENDQGQLGTAPGPDSATPLQIPGITGATDIATGEDHACAVVGVELRCWGNNDTGQLGDGTMLDSPTPVTANVGADVTVVGLGDDFTCAGTTTGIRCFGENSDGTLGNGTTTDSGVAVDVTGVPAPTEISGNEDHICALAGGDVWCWGNNPRGELGRGFVSDEESIAATVVGLPGPATALDAGDDQTCAVTEPGLAFCWGNNTQGEIGTAAVLRTPVPGPVVGATDPMALVGGGDNTRLICALDAAGNPTCWGDPNILGADEPVVSQAVPTALFGTIDDLSNGSDHACTVTTAGAGQCVGDNSLGQLGDGTTIDRDTPVTPLVSNVTAIGAGEVHSCAVQSAAALCWGGNTFGQLGDSSNTPSSSPVPVTGLGANVETIAVGQSFACVVVGGAAQCWGFNGSGELGDGTNTASNAPVAVTGLGTGVADVVAGTRHACALLDVGTVECWGDNNAGQLGDGTNTTRSSPAPVPGLTGVTALFAGPEITCATTAASFLCWGDNDNGQVGVGNEDPVLSPTAVVGLSSLPTSVALSGRVSCAITPTDGAQCWGENDTDGRLANGADLIVLAPFQINSLPDRMVTADVVVQGGTATAADFTVDVSDTGGSVGSGTDPEPGAGNAALTFDLPFGDYTVSLTGPAGYDITLEQTPIISGVPGTPEAVDAPSTQITLDATTEYSIVFTAVQTSVPTTPTTTPPTPTTSPPTPPTTEPPTPVLPETGASSDVAVAALVALLAGFALVAATRRRPGGLS